MPRSSPVAWAVRAVKAVLVVRVVLVPDDPVAGDPVEGDLAEGDMTVLMLRVEIRNAIARDDQHRNRS